MRIAVGGQVSHRAQVQRGRLHKAKSLRYVAGHAHVHVAANVVQHQRPARPAGLRLLRVQDIRQPEQRSEGIRRAVPQAQAQRRIQHAQRDRFAQLEGGADDGRVSLLQVRVDLIHIQSCRPHEQQVLLHDSLRLIQVAQFVPKTDGYFRAHPLEMRQNAGEGSVTQVHRTVDSNRSQHLASLTLGQSLHEQVRVAAAHGHAGQQVGVRIVEPLGEPAPLLGVRLVQPGDPQLLDQLVLASQWLVAGAHHQRWDRDIRLIGARFRRVGVQYLPVQPAQPLGDVVEGTFLHLPGVGQQQPGDVLRRLRGQAQLPCPPPRPDEQVLLHRRLVYGIALQVLLGCHVARRFDAGVGKFQDPVVAAGNDSALPSPVLRVGQPPGGHFGPNRRRVFAGQQPAHSALDLHNLRQPSPVRRDQAGRLLVQPGGQPG